MENVFWLKEVNDENAHEAGVKAANLAELNKNALQVPTAYVISATCFKKFLEESELRNKINNLLSIVDVNDTDRLQDIANEIQKIIVMTTIPEEIREEIIEYYDSFHTGNMLEKKDVFVAVRSSPTLENRKLLKDVKQISYLNILGKEKLLKAIQACWASLFTANLIKYREMNNISHDTMQMAVLVQEMIQSRKSGIAYSSNPTGNNEEIIVKACFGLGEALATGQISPDEYTVEKDHIMIKKRSIAKQKWQYVLDIETNKTMREDLNEHGMDQKLEDAEIEEVARLAKRIEKLFSASQEIEFAFTDKLYVLQTRKLDHSPVYIEPEIKEPEEKEEIDVVDLEKEAYKSENFEKKEPEYKEYKEEVKEKETGEYDNPKLLLSQAKFQACNAIIACDMAITSSLKTRYVALYGEKPQLDFEELINEVKVKGDIPLEEEIRRVHKIRDKFLDEYEHTQVEDLRFVLETTEKFIELFQAV